VSDSAADTAVITKMVRVMMLAPFLLMLSAYLARSESDARARARADAGTPVRSKISIPWFALWFVAVAALHSAMHLPARLMTAAVNLDTFILAMAMGALGLTTHRSAIGNAGLKPIALGALLFAWLIVGGAVVNTAIGRML
jgi:uncharacterized integral membrane protein (TIGR00698 family)